MTSARGALARGCECRNRTDLLRVVASYLIVFEIAMAYSYTLEWELVDDFPVGDKRGDTWDEWK